MGDAKRRPLVDAGSVVDPNAIDGILIAIGVIGVVLIAVAMIRARRKQPERPRRTDGWRSGAASVCAAGREVIDLTATYDTTEAQGGLTVDRLSVIESKLDLLVAQIHDVQATAPAGETARHLRLAALHATSLNETVRALRRVRLKSVSSRPDQYSTFALQLAEHRSALDDVLSVISQELGEER